MLNLKERKFQTAKTLINRWGELSWNHLAEVLDIKYFEACGYLDMLRQAGYLDQPKKRKRTLFYTKPGK